MNIISSRKLRVLSICAVLAVGIATTIASGGGGGGGSTPPPAGNEPTLPITTNNGDDVASALLITIGFTFNLGDILGGDLLAQAAVNPLSLAGPRILRDLAAKAAKTVRACDYAGTVDVTETVANPNYPTIGDRIVAVFDNCDDNHGYVISGTVDLTISSLQGNLLSNVFLIGFDVLVTDVAVTEGDDVFTADGDFSLTMDSLDFPVITMTVAGNELRLGALSEITTLIDFDHWLTVDSGIIPNPKLAEASGRMDSTALGGSVDYRTTSSIRAVGDLDAHEGEILITGAGGSTVTIKVVDASHVTLEIDTNGDGTVDQFIDTTWSALTGGTPSAISSDNVPIVAREVFNAVTGFGSVAISAGAQFAPNAVFEVVRQQSISGDFGPLPIDCATSGSAMVSGSILTAATFSTSDSLNAVFSACVRESERLDGEMRFTVGGYTRTPGDAYAVNAAVAATALRRGNDGTCYTGSGAFTTEFDLFFTTPGTVSATSSAQSFVVSTGGRSQKLRNASVRGRIEFGQQPPTVFRESAGSFSGTDLVGDFTYQSISPDVFVVDGDPATGPSSGELLVTAYDGSSLHLVALDNLNVRLDADYNGDSIIDQQFNTTWAALGYGNAFGMCD